MDEQPSDEQYTAWSADLVRLAGTAGNLLVTAVGEGNESARRAAEDVAREAYEVRERMRTWRLAHGYQR